MTEKQQSPPPHCVAQPRDEKRASLIDLITLILVGIVAFVSASATEAFERFYSWSRSHESWQIDELATLSVVLMVCFGIYSWRRWRALKREITRREALAEEVSQLECLLPICSYCHQIRDEDDIWQSLETYLTETGTTEFSHSICPTCYAKHVLPQLRADIERISGRSA
jgi:ABC-type nickel/cobalt efflux system permease component RcnA